MYPRPSDPSLRFVQASSNSIMCTRLLTNSLPSQVAMQQQRLAHLGIGPSASKSRRRDGHRQPGTIDVGDEDDSDENDDGTLPLPTLSLAMRMGLEEAPEPELTTSEWDAIAEQSRRRDESRQPCVICQEHFRDEKQVLLSCGHVFHRACLRSWERHSNSRSCPVCRKLHYRKRAIADGANIYREECATRLQAAWRGLAARRSTSKALRNLNPRRLRRYCEDRLGGLTDQLLGRIERERSAVDELFAEIDTSVAASRLVMGVDEISWADVEATATSRGLGDCPVCLAPLAMSDSLTLLSCSHVFHDKCLASFERFSLSTNCLCPVCRQSYIKRPFGQAACASSGCCAPVCCECSDEPSAAPSANVAGGARGGGRARGQRGPAATANAPASGRERGRGAGRGSGASLHINMATGRARAPAGRGRGAVGVAAPGRGRMRGLDSAMALLDSIGR